jgi:hypothetical protein
MSQDGEDQPADADALARLGLTLDDDADVGDEQPRFN